MQSSTRSGPAQNQLWKVISCEETGSSPASSGANSIKTVVQTFRNYGWKTRQETELSSRLAFNIGLHTQVFQERFSLRACVTSAVEVGTIHAHVHLSELFLRNLSTFFGPRHHSLSCDPLYRCEVWLISADESQPSACSSSVSPSGVLLNVSWEGCETEGHQ